MLPWAHGFTWDIGHLVFLGIFYSVVLVIFVTVARALWRARQDFKRQKQEEIVWEASFEDLPATARVCRHELRGAVAQRQCDHEFDCRTCSNHPKILAQAPLPAVTAQDKEEEVFGMHLPLDRFYHRGHTWARPEPDGTVTVGLDDLGARLIGEPDGVELPQVGTAVQVNGTGWHLRKQKSRLRILSPVAGEVIATGGPHQGWYLRVRPHGNRLDTRHLLRGAEIRPWIMRELERLQFALAPAGVGLTLADGGVPVEDIAKSDPQADWDSALGDLLLQP